MSENQEGVELLRPEQVIEQIKLMQSPFAVMMVGLPGTGKTTFVKHLTREVEFVIASHDDVIEDYATSHGITYDAAFYRLDRKEVEKQWREKLKRAVATKQNAVIDQTNCGAAARHRKLATFRKAKYPHVAVECTSSMDEIRRRLQLRSEEGKTIPTSVMQSMVAGYQRPQLSEGFSRVFKIKT